ncbi:MAG: hypothetical protein O7B27_13115 [Gammaproteobacteria bacterium]|nr:hypothetical protein [Gammaproteobacteria bacterium]
MTEGGTDRQWYEYVKRNRVFILGAGFSDAAGVPLTAPLLEKAMGMFSVECPGLFSRVDGYARESVEDIDSEVNYTAIDFSDFCTYLEYVELREYGGGERWANTGSREKLALRFYLAKTIAEHTPSKASIPPMYVEFAEQLHKGDIVISFNWDGLLEVALQRVGKPYTYNFSAEDHIKLCKLHGSVNWRLDEPNNLGTPVDTLGWESLRFTEGMMTTEIFHTPALLNFETWRSYSPLGEVEPFLVLPGYGKAFDVRSNAVLWYKPEWAFAFTHDVYIIGLSLAPDDFFIRSLFLANLPFIGSYSPVKGRQIYIINPDPKAAENYKFVLSKGHAKLWNTPFGDEHIAYMKESQANA